MSRMVEPIPKSKPAGKSARKRLFDSEFEAAKAVVAERSRGWCEFPDCTRWARIFHHRKGRVGPDVNLPEHVAHLCNDHHARVHSHVKESYENGMLIRRTSTAHTLEVVGEWSMSHSGRDWSGRCSCGWTVRFTGTPASEKRVRDAHQAHVEVSSE